MCRGCEAKELLLRSIDLIDQSKMDSLGMGSLDSSHCCKQTIDFHPVDVIFLRVLVVGSRESSIYMIAI